MLNKRHLLAFAAVSASIFGGSQAVAMPGSLDPEFSLPTFNNNEIHAMSRDADGRIIITGSFTDVGPRITALLPDGTVDTAFIPGTGPNSTGRAVAVDAQGLIYVGGDFSQYNGMPRPGIARLLADGTLDTDFNPGTGFTGPIYRLLPLPNGQLLAAGGFYEVQGQSIIGIVRLNADGTLDDTFGVTTGTNNVVSDIVLLNDGRIVLGGAFTQYNGTPRNRIAVLNADGTLDETFDMGSGFNGSVTALELTAGGKLLAAGSFSAYNGTAQQRFVRLNPDGTLDGAFDAGAAANSTVNAIVEEVGGRIVIAGSFTSVDGVARSRIARLRANGEVDLDFDPGTGASSTINVVLDLEGLDRLLIGGVFTSYNTEFTGRLAAVIGGGYEGETPDGGFPSWIAGYYPGAGGNQNIVGPEADPESDGIPNLAEYALGGDPTVHDRGQLPVMSTVSDGGQDFLRISFTRRQEAWDVIYVVQVTNDLSTWTDFWSSTDHPYTSSQEQITQTVTDTEPMTARRFLRLAVFLDPDAEYEEPPPAGDGIDSWRAGFFDAGQLADPDISGPGADPDADGVPNLLEYAFFGSPVAGSRAVLPESTIADVAGQAHLAVSFVRVRDASDITYRVQASPDLITWTEIWTSADFPYQGTEATSIETVTDTEPMDSGGTNSRFLRVDVLLEEGA